MREMMYYYALVRHLSGTDAVSSFSPPHNCSFAMAMSLAGRRVFWGQAIHQSRRRTTVQQRDGLCSNWKLSSVTVLPQGSRQWRTFGTTNEPSQDTTDPSTLLYESPLGTVVTRLRAVSMTTGICGCFGLPLVVAIKGGELPATGLLATGLMFCMMSLGSTAAVHYVFHPYVYEIHRIPVRLCSFTKAMEVGDDEADTEDVPVEEVEPTTIKGPFLYKAVSKSLFLGNVSTVFDPSSDLVAYKGLRPMCNLTAKGVPLYVHPQQVHNQELKEALHFLTNIPKETPAQDNPDDFL